MIKKAFPKAYLEQRKYKLKKKKHLRYIDHLEIIDYDSDRDSDSYSIDFVEIKNDNEIKSKEEIENLSLFR